MKYVKFLLLILIAFPKISPAQKNELINSGELIKKGKALYDSSQYKSAISEFDKVARSDTNYVWSLYEKALSCEADSQYNQAIKYCEEGLSLKEQRQYEPDLYNSYGNTLNEIGQPDKALKVFDSAIAKYPSYSYLYFNKGVVMLALKRPNEAEQLFQKTLLINPYMYSAHYQLGIAAMRQGKVIPSFLSFIGYLLVNPQGKYWSSSINLLNQISRSTDEVLDYKNKRKVAPDDNYQAVEDIVLSKIALDEAYKPKIALDDPISRQIQAVFEKLEYNDSNNDFWIQYYLPFFNKVNNDGRFELFINRIFSNVKAPVIQDYNKKKAKELEGLRNDAAAYFDLIRSTRELHYKMRDTITERYLFEDGKLVGKGTLANKGKILSGSCDGYYSAGNLKFRGVYNMTGEREGDWAFYSYSGKVNGKEHYVNGKLEGGQDYFFDNGNLSSHDNYVNGHADGLVTAYYYTGNIKSTTNYKLGKKDGEQKEFYSNGSLQSTNNYTNGVLDGVSNEYYKNGRPKETEQYANGKAEGVYKSYYENGGLSVEGQNLKDKSDGEWKYYYENGKIKEKRNYLNDLEEGFHEEYDEDGHLSESYAERKGKINGEATWYYKDQKVLSKYVYDNGNIKSAKYFDRSGAVISSQDIIDNDHMSIVSYDVEGAKKSHFRYNKKGDLDGPDTLFYPSGKIDQVNEYKNGELNGPSITYYLNGGKKSEVNYADGKQDGSFTGFYVNGKTETEGWVSSGQYQGEWKYYDELGRLTSKYYYLDGDFDGYKEDYLPNGQKTMEQKYHQGWLEKLTQYDNAGNVIAVDSFPKGSGKYVLYYPNKKVMAETNYINGDFNGPYKTYYFDGSIESQFFYKKGMRDSAYSSYYYGGAKDVEGSYSFGNKVGTWKYYYEDGKLYSAAEYANDAINGEKTYYSTNGTKDLVSMYKNDLLNGPVKKYDPEGTLAYEITFESDNAKAYSYIGSDGKQVPHIPIAAANGIVKAYFQNGKVSRDCKYSDGIKNGQDIVYYSNGQVRSIDTAAYGIVDGVSKEYYPNGKVKSEYYYSTDNATGICREFEQNGILKKEIVYENGVYHGPTKYYDGNGKLIKTMLYNYGTLISVKNEK